jgi:hypothetical protein
MAPGGDPRLLTREAVALGWDRESVRIWDTYGQERKVEGGRRS